MLPCGAPSPATFDVFGTAPGSPAVTVNGNPATYQGDHFRAQVTASNANTNGEWKAVTVVFGGNTESGHRYVAPATFTPEFDVDGNLTDDGEWNYAWDAENRLITMTRTTRAQTAGAPYRRVGFTYDAQHRCVERREYHTSGGSAVKTERYLYDGWNRVATLNAANQPQQRFTWGTDLSGGMQGAGGVGGLLWIEDVPTATVHLVCMDGNGNVTALVNAATKQPTARYDYGPFGDLLRQSGPYASANPYRFSTKPQDPVTRLLYYGYRWFKPDWNTWTSRDPIGERGINEPNIHHSNLTIDYQLPEELLSEILSRAELNLYGFINNRPVDSIDLLGLFEVTFKIVTEIRRSHGILVPSAAKGVKTTHELVFETDTGDVIRRSGSAGKTFGFIPASSGFLEDVWKETAGGKCIVHATMVGWAKNWANPFLGSINYDLKLEIDLKAIPQTMKLTGKHDGFPSYIVNFDYGLYDFDEISPDKLKAPMDITVNESRP